MMRVKKLLYITTNCLLFAVILPGLAFAQFSGGAGTEDSPYQVETLNQLQEVQDHTDKHFIQTANINASETVLWNNGKGFNPIGSDEAKFTGSYNGNGFEITGLSIDREDENNVGLFGFIEGGMLRNISLVNVSISGNNQIGALVGEMADGDIMNCSSAGSVAGISSIGGLVGMNTGNVEGSHSIGEVTGGASAGGLIGSNFGGDITDSYSESDITGWSAVGGLIGSNILNIDTGHGNITSSYAEGNISGDDFDIGGLVGNNSGSIIESYAKGTVTGAFPDLVNPVNGVGGLVGNNSGLINRSYAEGAVEGQGYVVGGLVGDNRGLEINESYASGEVSGWRDVGGLIGINSGDISASYSEGNVIGDEVRIGGLIGDNRSGQIYISYATGNAMGEEVGGLIGFNREDGEIMETYSTGEVTGAINAGGLIGVNGAAVFSSYWDIDNSNQNQSIGSGSSYGMIGLKTVQMKGTHAYDNMTDFNFEENWLLTEGYPALYWQDVDSIPIPTSTTESNEFPQTFKLKQNYPNPFNGTTIIEYGLPSGGDVLIDVYNLLGQKISTLVNSNMSAGWHEVTFDAERYSSGVYIYRLQVSDFVETKKFTLIK